MIADALTRAFRLIVSGDAELLNIVALSLQVSGLALAISLVIALPAALLLGLKDFPLKSLLISLANALLGLPPVVVGLIIYLLLSRSGPLGILGWLYTPTAMVIAQIVLAVPVLVSLCHAAIAGLDPVLRQAALTLGATPIQMALTLLREARYGILAGVVAGLGRLLSEVGAILIVGGNIAGYTRVMTTTIAFETDKGDFELALALGLILLLISLTINGLLHHLQRRGRPGAAP